MKMNKLFLMILIMVSSVTFIGCNNNSSDFATAMEEQRQNYFSKTGTVFDGIFVAPPATPSGMRITAEKNTFRSNTEITVIEKDFTGKGSDFLTNADKAFEIRGVIVSDDPTSTPIEIKTVEKPVKVVVPNTIKGNVNGYFLGVRDNDNSPWKFKQINYENNDNGSMFISSVRANVTGSEFSFQTNRLGFQFALFADLKEASKLEGATVVENIETVVQAENASPSSALGEIRIVNGNYLENMKVTIKISGKNLSNLSQLNYKPEILFVNNNSTDNKKIFWNSASYDAVEMNSGTSNGYVHRITINNFLFDGNTITFILNTMGSNIDDFPQNFIITVRDSANEQRLLPFEYSVSIGIENSAKDEPLPDPTPYPVPGPDPDPEPAKKLVAPRNVIVSNSRFTLGSSITVSWDSGNPELENVVYDVLFSCGNASETVMAASLTETIWTLAADENNLEVGSYSVRIAVRNTEGKTLYSDIAIFYIIDASIPETYITELNPINNLGEEIPIKWKEVNDPLGNSILYSLWVWNVAEEMPSDSIYRGTESSYVARNLASGSYKVKVTATNGTDFTEGGTIATFSVIATTTATLGIDSVFIGEDGLYSREPIFTITLSEKNFIKEDVINSISFEGPGDALPRFTLDGSVMTMKFDKNLERNSQYSIRMNPCRDIYGNDIVPFNQLTFTTFYFDGTGEDITPYTWELVPQIVELTLDGDIPLIGTVTVDISDVLNSFGNIQICDTASIFNASTAVWNDLPVILENNVITLGIGSDELWEPSLSMQLKVKFSGMHNGKKVYFITDSLNISTESGLVITMGNGTAEKPYLVYTKYQLDDIRNHLNSYILQVRNLNLEDFYSVGSDSGSGWLPIGEYVNADLTTAFSGTFDGNGKTIANLRITSDKPYVGLFGVVRGEIEGGLKPAVIKNVTLNNCHIISNFDSYSLPDVYSSIGSLVGCAVDNVEITDCSVDGDVWSIDGAIGGIIGEIEGIHYSCGVTNCSFAGNVSVDNTDDYSCSSLGGCMGGGYNVVVRNCQSTGTVSDNSSSMNEFCSAGGLIGAQTVGLVLNCYSSSTVKGVSYVGGLTGSLCEADCLNSYYNGDSVTCLLEYCGGFAGRIEYCDVKDCQAVTQSVVGYRNVAGFIGSGIGINASNCNTEVSFEVKIVIPTALGFSDLPYNCAGFVAYGSGNFENCSANVNKVESEGYNVGGFAGYYWGNDSSYHMNNCVCQTGSVSGYAIVGGFVGESNAGYLANCRAVVTGNITGYGFITGDSHEIYCYLGGFAGSIDGHDKIVCCSCEFDRVVNPNFYYAIGGFAGRASMCNVSDCYARGNTVKGYDYVGGFIGSGTLNINNCYTTAEVDCSEDHAAQFIGFMNSPHEFNSCFTLNRDGGTYAFVNGNYSTMANCYSDAAGYIPTADWGSHPWNEAIWDLSSTDSPNLPTLRPNNLINFEDYPVPASE